MAALWDDSRITVARLEAYRHIEKTARPHVRLLAERASISCLDMHAAREAVAKAKADWEQHALVKAELCDLALILPGECAALLRDQFGVDVDIVTIDCEAIWARNRQGAVVLALPMCDSPMPVLVFASDAASRATPRESRGVRCSSTKSPRRPSRCRTAC